VTMRASPPLQRPANMTRKQLLERAGCWNVRGQKEGADSTNGWFLTKWDCCQCLQRRPTSLLQLLTAPKTT
jgi:hypothetical protein